MKKIENFCNCLHVLQGADFVMAEDDEIYRTGVIGQFNLTFELSWKAIKAVLEANGVGGAETGSPRDIIKLAAKTGLITDQLVWMLMLKERNLAIHIYDEDQIDEFLILIRDSFLPAFEKLEKVLAEEQRKIEADDAQVEQRLNPRDSRKDG